jgi:RHS repeat-associated protein
MGGSYARTNLPQALSSSTYDDANRLTQRGTTTLSYDDNGNLTSDGVNTYTWNARNQMASISGGTSASFQYDAFGRRVGKTINSVSTSFLYSGVNVVQELSGTTPTANMLTGKIDEVFTRTDSAGAHHFLSDALHSPFGLTNASGTLETQYTYEPFGLTSVSGTTGSNVSQFTGRENDNTGLYYFRARYYSPLFQRFISEDPIRFCGGDTNFYAYVKNRPLTAFDPLGLQDEHDPEENPAQTSPSEIVRGEVVAGAAELGGVPFGAEAVGLGDLAPGLYNYVEQINRRNKAMNDICCATKTCPCNPSDPDNDPSDPDEDPLDPNGPNPRNPNRPNGPNHPGSPGNPLSPGRGK